LNPALSTHHSVLLQIRYQFPDIFTFDSRHQRPLAQVPLAFFALARKQVALEPFISFDLPAPRHPESLGCSSVGFDFWHLCLL
jgi:hypothetical protein